MFDKKAILFLVFIVLVTLSLSGCTYVDENKTNAPYNVGINGLPKIDGPIENGTSSYYTVTIPIQNGADKDYKSFGYVVTGYGTSGNIIGESKGVYYNIATGQMANIVLNITPTKTDEKLIKVDLRITNATTGY